jgi:DNA-binding beta-propeller fold protein YncE
MNIGGSFGRTLVVALVAVVGALGLSCAPAAAVEAHNFAASFGGSGASALSHPEGVAINQLTGDVYVVDGAHDRVEIFNSSGVYVSTFGSGGSGNGQFKGPTAIAVDNSSALPGDVYVLDSGNMRVEKFNSKGEFLSQVTEAEVLGASGGELKEIDGLAVGPEGNLWISGEDGGLRMFEVPAGGSIRLAYSSNNTTKPGLAVNASDEAYVVNGTGVARYAGNGEHLVGVGFNEGANLTGLALDQTTGGLYLDRGTEIAHYLTPPTASEPAVDSFGSEGANALSQGSGIAVNEANGTVYVADAARDAVDIFDPITRAGVSLEPASAVGKTAATLRGLVNPSGLAVTACQFEYGTQRGVYPETAPCSALPGSGEAAVAVAASIAGLQTHTTYYYKLSASDANGTNVTSGEGKGVESFTTQQAVEGVESGLAENVTGTGTELTGTLSPDGTDTHYYFEYGLTTAYGASAPAPPGTDAGVGGSKCEPPGGAECAPVEATATLAGLSANTTYHYRLVATDSFGTAYGKDMNFTTFGAPRVNSVSAEVPSGKVGQSEASLRATITPDGGETTYQFQYGETSSYGQSIPVAPAAIGAGRTAVSVPAAVLAALKLGTTYHYRVVAENAYGQTASADQTFSTLGAALVEDSFSGVSATAAKLEAQIDPLGSATSCKFEYLPQTDFEARGWGGAKALPCPAPLGDGEAPVSATVELTELEPLTEYRVRAVAENALGVAFGLEGAFSTQGAGRFALPDGRQWQLVSPPNKQGAGLAALDAVADQGGAFQAAANGEAFTFLADAPTEPGVAGNANMVQVLASRSPSGWRRWDLAPPHVGATAASISSGNEYTLFNEDLSVGVVQPFGHFNPALSDEASEQTLFVHTDFASGEQSSPCRESCYKPVLTSKAPFANVLPGTQFGEYGNDKAGQSEQEGTRCPPHLICGPIFRDATADISHILFSSPAQLTTTPVPPEEPYDPQLYEWNGGAPPSEQVRLVSVLPAAEGGHPASSFTTVGADNADMRGALASNGTRVFFTSDNKLYMRDVTSEKTLRVDLPEPGCGGCGMGAPDALFEVATGSGARVFFKDGQQLTADAGANGATGRDLYECAITEIAGELACTLTDLTPKNAASESGEVQGGVVAASEDGEWLYFVANGLLENKGVPVAGAVHGDCRRNGGSDTGQQRCNLYVRHNGATSLVAVLSGADYADWAGGGDGNDIYGMSARISPDGQWLAFQSDRGLTGYDTRDAISGQADEEVYLYHASTGALACVSCDPTGARPEGVELNGASKAQIAGGGESLWLEHSVAADIPGWTRYGRSASITQAPYLSNSGRIFFNSYSSLVPADINGTWDVYEYEPQGVGGPTAPCDAAAQTGSEAVKAGAAFEVGGVRGEEGAGCVALISSGESPEESGFLGASETGGDVFFLTRSKLTSEDYDESYDIYDAHECTANSPCLPEAATQPPECTSAAQCRAEPPPQPEIFGAPSSSTFAGEGNEIGSTNAVSGNRGSTGDSKKLTRSQKRARALKACSKKRNRRKRARCDMQARHRFKAAQFRSRKRGR